MLLDVHKVACVALRLVRGAGRTIERRVEKLIPRLSAETPRGDAADKPKEQQEQQVRALRTPAHPSLHACLYYTGERLKYMPLCWDAKKRALAEGAAERRRQKGASRLTGQFGRVC